MKNIYKYSIVLLAALLCAPMTTLADVDPNDPSITRGNGVVLKKTVRDATTDEKGEYILTLEAYATGTSATTITEETDAQTIPCDIVLLLDESGSMRATFSMEYLKGTQITSGSLSSTTNQTYVIEKDGKEYYMKGFYSNESYTLVNNYVKAGTGLSYSVVGSNTYYIRYNGQYYKVRRGGRSGSRNLQITYNDYTRYLDGTDISESAPAGKNNSDVIWSGDYYSKSSGLSFGMVCDVTNNTTPAQTNATPYPITNFNEYYVKYSDATHPEAYYLVSPYFYYWSGRGWRYYLTITVDGQKLYLKGTGFSKNEYYMQDDKNADIWTGDFYTKAPGSNATYTYVYNTSVPTDVNDGTKWVENSSSEPTVNSSDKVYRTSLQLNTRENIMRKAALEFVDVVYANSPDAENGSYHNLAIGCYSNSVKWLYPGNSTDAALNTLNSDNVTAIKSKISDFTTTETGTQVQLATEAAKNLLATVQNDGRNKIVVIFTDGEPGTNGGTMLVQMARQAIEDADYIKNNFTNTVNGNEYPALVYSIGFLAKESSDKNDGNNNNPGNLDIRRFLHYLSSNYKTGIAEGTSYNFMSNYSGATPAGGDESSHDYYQFSDGSNLSTIFQTVASQAASGQTTGGANRQLGANTTTVLDIISEEFRLPTDITTTVGDFVKVYTMHVDSDESSENNYVWDMDDDSQAAPTIAYSKEEGTLNDIVRVNGFDFTKADEYNEEGTDIVTYGHWVGPREIGNTTTYAGHKLVIEIPIIKADNYNGGFNTPTNTSSSALVYVNPDNNKEEKVLAFAIPDLDFPSLAVAKSGLEPGESAIFTVKQLSGWNEDGTALVEVENGISYTVIVTNDGTEITRKISGVTDVNGSLSKTVNDTEYWYEIIKDIPEGMYQVTETPWSWTYTTSIPTHKSYTTVGTNAIQQFVTKDQITANHADGEFEGWGDAITKKIIIFEFNNSKKESNPAHGEDSKKNVFQGVGANGGNGNTDEETEP